MNVAVDVDVHLKKNKGYKLEECEISYCLCFTKIPCYLDSFDCVRFVSVVVIVIVSLRGNSMG